MAGQDTGKHSKETKDLIRKRQSKSISITADSIEIAELSKFIKTRHTQMRKFNMNRFIERALKYGGSLKAVKRRLGMVENHMYSLKLKQANVIRNKQ